MAKFTDLVQKSSKWCLVSQTMKVNNGFIPNKAALYIKLPISVWTRVVAKVWKIYMWDPAKLRPALKFGSLMFTMTMFDNCDISKASEL